MMGGFVFDTSYTGETLAAKESLSKPSTRTDNTCDVPNFETFHYIMKHFPHIIPDISEESITDRVEDSSLSKGLLIFQIAWFFLNCASRIIQRLPLSTLEVSTIAHGFCTLITYGVWWFKPHNVAAGTLMWGEEARQVHALLMCTEKDYDEALWMVGRIAAGEYRTAGNGDTETRVVLAAKALQRLPNPERPPLHPFRGSIGSWAPGSFSWDAVVPNGFRECITIAAPPMLYGLVHFIAWNARFPTFLECILWRVAAFAVTSSGLVMVAWGLTMLQLRSCLGRDSIFIKLGMFAVLFVYTLASGFLLTESIRQLFYLEPAAYRIPSWSNHFPHFS